MTMSISRERLGLPETASCLDPRNDCLALTEPIIADLCVWRGDTGRFLVIVTEADGQTPIDITSASWRADVRDANDILVAYFVVTPYPNEPHIADVVLLPDQSARLSGAYSYDVEMSLNGAVTTLVAGTLTVNPDVSRIA